MPEWRAERFLNNGAIAQLGERVLCKHEVVGSIPSGSTIRTITSDNDGKNQTASAACKRSRRL
jgi:hypothetical protein